MCQGSSFSRARSTARFLSSSTFPWPPASFLARPLFFALSLSFTSTLRWLSLARSFHGPSLHRSTACTRHEKGSAEEASSRSIDKRWVELVYRGMERAQGLGGTRYGRSVPTRSRRTSFTDEI